jgi:hypothetical protein
MLPGMMLKENIKAGQDIPVALIEQVEERYAEAIRRMKSIQLRMGIKLGRSGAVLRERVMSPNSKPRRYSVTSAVNQVARSIDVLYK